MVVRETGEAGVEVLALADWLCADSNDAQQTSAVRLRSLFKCVPNLVRVEGILSLIVAREEIT